MGLETPNYQYPEDISHVSGDIGTVALAVRKDTAGSLVSSDGDYATLQVNALGELRCDMAAVLVSLASILTQLQAITVLLGAGLPANLSSPSGRLQVSLGSP